MSGHETNFMPAVVCIQLTNHIGNLSLDHLITLGKQTSNLQVLECMHAAECIVS